MSAPVHQSVLQRPPPGIAILGSGRVASSLAGKLLQTGHRVTLGSRSPNETSRSWEGADVSITDATTAVRDADIVINATPGESSLERLTALRDELDGTILVDVSNTVGRSPDGGPGDLTYPNGSLAEQLQRALPGTRVVKTLNTMLHTVMIDPGSLSAPPTAFMSGNDDDAKSFVRALLMDLGWPTDQILDLGDVTTARGAEALILLVPSIIRVRGFKPFAVTVLD